MSNEETEICALKQAEQNKLLKIQEDLLHVYKRQIENMQQINIEQQEQMLRDLRQERTRHLNHINAWIQQGQDKVQYHSEEECKLIQHVETLNLQALALKQQAQTLQQQAQKHKQIVLANQVMVHNLIIEKEQIEMQLQ